VERLVTDRLRWTAVGLAVVLFAAGMVGVGRGWAWQGLLVVFGAGLMCLLLALVAHRLIGVQVEHGNDGTKVAFVLDRAEGLTPTVVRELQETGLTGVAATYAFVHNQLADDPGSTAVKIKLQDQLVAMVKANAFNEPIDANRVERALTTGSPAERVLAFGLLQSDPQLATVDLLRRGIEQSRSGNEQYHALLATLARWPTLPRPERDELRRSVREAPHIADDVERAERAERLLADGPGPAREPLPREGAGGWADRRTGHRPGPGA
jgi:hypothetical protein